VPASAGSNADGNIQVFRLRARLLRNRKCAASANADNAPPRPAGSGA